MSQPPTPGPNPPAPRPKAAPNPKPGHPTSTDRFEQENAKIKMRYILVRTEARLAANVPTLQIGTWFELLGWMKGDPDMMTKERKRAIHDEFLCHYKLLVEQGFDGWPTRPEDATSGLNEGYRGRGPMFEERMGGHEDGEGNGSK